MVRDASSSPAPLLSIKPDFVPSLYPSQAWKRSSGTCARGGLGCRPYSALNGPSRASQGVMVGDKDKTEVKRFVNSTRHQVLVIGYEKVCRSPPLSESRVGRSGLRSFVLPFSCDPASKISSTAILRSISSSATKVSALSQPQSRVRLTSPALGFAQGIA